VTGAHVLRRAGIGFAIGLGAALVAVLAGQLDFAGRVEDSSYDRRVAWTATPLPADSPIVIIEINDSSVRALEPLVGRWPWPRVVHAGVVDYLAQSGATVVAYDVLFLEREGRVESEINGQRVTGDQSDLALAESIRLAGNVVLLAEATYEGLVTEAAEARNRPASPALPGRGYRPGEGFQRREWLQMPLEDLRRGASGVGHNLLVRDSGSDFARRMLPFIAVGDAAVPSLGVAAALDYADVPEGEVRLEDGRLRLGDVLMPLVETEASRQTLLRFHQPMSDPDGVESVFPTYSFFDVLLSADQLASGGTPAVPPSAFEGKLVFVGTRAAGTYDRYTTPFASGAAGVELHATLAQSILSGGFMARASGWTDAALTVLTGLASGLAAVLLPVYWAPAGVLALAAGLVAWVTHQVSAGLWVAAVTPLLAAALALFGGVAWRYLVEDRAKREVRRLFGRYVSDDIIEQLMSNPALAGLGGERRDMTVLFSDIRGFTAATERGEPDEVVAQLNEYFGEMVPVLFRHRGTLDKFVGDMVMGLFGAPLPDPDHADHAVAAALEMTRTLDALNRRWQADGKAAVDIGIGINSGDMIAGNIGSAAIMSYTVIGDAVNLASRLESLNKQYGTRVIISEATRARLTIPVSVRPIGDVMVKGRTQPVLIHEVMGTREGFGSSDGSGPSEAPAAMETELR
jgi:adenylate cyclase